MAYTTLYKHYYKDQQRLMYYLDQRGFRIDDLISLRWADIKGSTVKKGRSHARLEPDIAKLWRRCKYQAGKQPIHTPLVFYKRVPDEFSPGVPYLYEDIYDLLGRPPRRSSGRLIRLQIPAIRLPRIVLEKA